VERSRQETIEEFGFDVQPTSASQAEQLDVFKKRVEADMLRQFWTQVNEEAEKIFVARKADAFPHFQKLLDDAKEETRKARRDQNNYRDFTAAQKLRMTPEQYMTVLRSVHPDNSASEETRAKAFRILTDLKFALTGKK
jgi:4'-phosphopantetheinyl transferase EntD